jgi:hypothetical protein
MTHNRGSATLMNASGIDTIAYHDAGWQCNPTRKHDPPICTAVVVIIAGVGQILHQ